jgi:hypothetical protein
MMDEAKINEILKKVPLSTRLKVANQLAMIELLTTMGYREDKSWGEEEDEKLKILTKAAQELAAKQMRILEPLIETLTNTRDAMCPYELVDDLKDEEILQFYTSVHKLCAESIDEVLIVYGK